VPRANLLYSTRNKILATSLLVEAFFYEEADPARHQHRIGKKAWRCGRPLHGAPQVSPCPVDIDFPESVHEHAQPVAQDGPEEFPPGNAAAMCSLNATNPQTIKVMRTAMVGVGLSSVWPTTC
jgi:hypothetical protein